MNGPHSEPRFFGRHLELDGLSPARMGAGSPAIMAGRALAYQLEQRQYGNHVSASEAVRHMTTLEALRRGRSPKLDAPFVAALAQLLQGRQAALGMPLSASNAVRAVENTLRELGGRFPE